MDASSPERAALSNRLAQWFATPLGQYLLGREQAWFDRTVADIFGFHAIQIGLPTGSRSTGFETTRRDVLSLMGFSLGAIGLGGCRAPVQHAVPLTAASTEMVPGVPNLYATTCGGCAAWDRWPTCAPARRPCSGRTRPPPRPGSSWAGRPRPKAVQNRTHVRSTA
jgi:hypothetical protein